MLVKCGDFKAYFLAKQKKVATSSKEASQRKEKKERK